MSPRYRGRALDVAHARRVEPVTSKPSEPQPGRVQCGRCHGWVVDPHRRHKAPSGVPCREPEPVTLDALPPVEIPPGRKTRPAAPRIGVRSAGACQTCGATVSGERQFCGLCLARRLDERR